MSLRVWIALWAVVTIFAVTTCSPSSSHRFDLETLASQGVTIDTLVTPGVSLKGVPDLTIGVDSGPAPYAFGRVGGVAADSEGRIVVADELNHELRVFSAEGEFLYRVGREGEGPGELRRPCCPTLGPEGRLWVRDLGNRRFNAYRLGQAGSEYLETVRGRASQGHEPVPLVFAPSGELVDVGWYPEGSDGYVKVTRHVLDRSGNELRAMEVPAPPLDRIGVATRQSETGNARRGTIRFIPFAPQHLVAHGPGGDWAEAISSEYLIRWNGPDGSLRTVLWRDAGPGPELTRSERQSAESLQDHLARETGWDPGVQIPDRKPVLAALYFDTGNRLWIEHTREGRGRPRRADVVSPDGTWVATVEWPAAVNLERGFLTGGRALGVTGNRLSVQRVVRLELVPEDPDP